MTFAESLNLVWPLTFLLLALLILRKVEGDFRPIVIGVVGGLASNAQKNATMYAMGLMMATAASLQSLGEVGTQFGWVYVTAFAKVMQPGVVAIVAYFMKPQPVSFSPPPSAGS